MLKPCEYMYMYNTYKFEKKIHTILSWATICTLSVGCRSLLAIRPLTDPKVSFPWHCQKETSVYLKICDKTLKCTGDVSNIMFTCGTQNSSSIHGEKVNLSCWIAAIIKIQLNFWFNILFSLSIYKSQILHQHTYTWQSIYWPTEWTLAWVTRR